MDGGVGAGRAKANNIELFNLLSVYLFSSFHSFVVRIIVPGARTFAQHKLAPLDTEVLPQLFSASESAADGTAELSYKTL